MSYFDSLNAIAQKLNDLYRPILQAYNLQAFNELNDNLIDSVRSATLVQQSFRINGVLDFINNTSKFMDINMSNNIDISDTLQSQLETISHEYQMFSKNILSFQNNYTEMINNLLSNNINFSMLINQAYLKSEGVESDDFNSNEEIVEALQEHENDPKKFQERIVNWSENKKKKYRIILIILFFIWNNIFGPYLQDTIGKPVAAYTISKIRELPKTTSKVIAELKENFEALIVEDVPYYYKVTFIDENGDEKEGYVAKKNLQIIEESEPEELSEGTFEEN